MASQGRFGGNVLQNVFALAPAVIMLTKIIVHLFFTKMLTRLKYSVHFDLEKSNNALKKKNLKRRIVKLNSTQISKPYHVFSERSSLQTGVFEVRMRTLKKAGSNTRRGLATRFESSQVNK